MHYKLNLKYLSLLVLLLFPLSSFAGNSLLYFEAQGVAGYSTKDDVIYRSAHSADVMQKNSLGLDYIQKFSGATGDLATLYFQGRLAYNHDHSETQNADKIQAQLYNAYLKVKTPIANIWGGHNKPTFGLASYLDNHADLLQPLNMYGLGFDRDWGVGFNRDFQNGDWALALTTGSGGRLRTRGNWLITSRASLGILNVDNYNLGFSFMGGEMLEVMGYELMDTEPKQVALAGIDFAFNHEEFEHKVELDAGSMADELAWAGFYRLSVNFLEENRLKLEAQYVGVKNMGQNNNYLGAGVSYRINSDLTARLMHEWDYRTTEKRFVGQVYWYWNVI
ncbi:MAG: hypothetical protein LBE20_02650 [Deltaproteobacteria bacterium]|nr:hypothetical protein [Deltaproteobacteria bacterium]